MKKFMVLLLAVGLLLFFATPVMANVENIFGGYMRVRAYNNTNFTGEDDTEAKDRQLVDTRTRLYYTAKFNDNFKFVNKFEIDNTWGDTDGGDIGADEVNIEVKNSYADFTLGSINSKIGMQGTALSRGFLFDDDFSGAIVTYQTGDISFPVFWMKAFEGYKITGDDTDKNDFDVDYYGINPTFKAGGATIKPLLMWITSKDVSEFDDDYANLEKCGLYYLGVDVDVDLDGASLWFTAIYETGSIESAELVGEEEIVEDIDADVSAYLVAVGASAYIDAINIHGQAFYATGDDNNEDDDVEAFFVPDGQSYYWAEIMGLGIFDANASNNSCADGISNIMALNIGATMKPMNKLSMTADIWYATLAEDAANDEDMLGIEVDLVATYTLMDNLKLDVVGAYLFAGDATYNDDVSEENEEDPYEFGARLSFKF